MLPLLLTVNQAAKLIGVGRTTIYELMDSGELFSVHRGASRRVPLWAAYDYVDRLCGGSFRQIPVPAVVDYLARLAANPDDRGLGADDADRATSESNTLPPDHRPWPPNWRHSIQRGA